MVGEQRWDIFCAVVDNFGDAGVCWRLARQLVGEHGLAVTLWVDQPALLARLWPALSAEADSQQVAGVTVRRWAEPLLAEPAAVVIEAFGCQLPASYREAMARQPRPPVWLNLEYLSAEAWVSDCHGLPSPQPGGLTKFFFFPGFDQRSGGLLREAGLLARRRAFDAAAQRDFLARIGVEPVPGRRLSLFAYENPAVAPLLSQLAGGDEPWLVLVPEGRVSAEVARWLGVQPLAIGATARRGAATVAALPFLSQTDYDLLLWSCDLNAVRGEDSFVRAQWAEAPLLWQIYPQEGGAHWHKLEAFLARYADESGPAALLAEANRRWNRGEAMAELWPLLRADWDALQAHARQWAGRLAQQPDLACALVDFAQRIGPRL
jgi:uncharacterized repeat protein (TIGR03837 family)